MYKSFKIVKVDSKYCDYLRKFDNKEYTVLDIMNTIVSKYKTKDTIKAPKIFHYMLAC